MNVFEDKQEELEHFETRMGIPRGRLAVTMDLVTDAMSLIGQHGVYCQSQRWPGKPVLDIQMVMKSLTDAKELIQSVMEELRTGSLVEIGLPELNFHRGTVMCFRRDCISEAAGRLIEIMRSKYHRSIINSSNQGSHASSASAVYEMDARSA